MDNLLGTKEIDAIIKMTKQKKGHGNMSEPTPKQKLIEAVAKEMQKSIDLENRFIDEPTDHYETGYQIACSKCIKLIEEILPNE